MDRETRQNEHIENLKKQLQEVRQQSLTATRAGDYRKIAKLTADAARLNRAINDAEVSKQY